MLSHEPKNYALLRYDGSLILHGVASRSSRAEPFGELFLRKAVAHSANGRCSRHSRHIPSHFGRPAATRTASVRYLIPSTAHQNTCRVLCGSGRPARAAVRSDAGEWSYVLECRRSRSRLSQEKRRVRLAGGIGRRSGRNDDTDDRDYDVDHYARQLRQTFASRLACAFTPADYEAVFADPDQTSLFMPAVTTIRTVLQQ